jgi:hypothetical protein
MTLTSRKIMVVSLIGAVFLLGNILLVANWIADTGVAEKANWVRHEFLTGTTVAITVILLVLLVSPKNGSKIFGFVRRCPVCEHRLIGRGSYCSECGSKV